MPQDYSDLQVVSDEAPKYAVVPEQNTSVPAYYPSDKIATDVNAYAIQDSEKAGPQPERKRICGLAAKTFRIVWAIVVVTVVAGAIGGAVVGGFVTKKSNNAIGPSATLPAGSQTTQSASSTESATRTTQSVSVTTSAVVGPSGTLLVDCPSSNNTIYTPSSSTQQFRKLCGKALVNIQNDAALVTEQVTTLDSCIDQCAAYNQQNAAAIASGAKSGCNAACWRSTGSDVSGWCYGYVTSNITIGSTSTFNFNNQTWCNSAALIGQ